MIEDYCRFFRKIEEDPKAIIKGLTVRDMLLAREHLNNCDSCFNISERMNNKAPELRYTDLIGEN